MPYKVVKRDDEWVVINTKTNEVKAHHDTQEDADGQVRLLHMLEKERDNA